MARPKALSDDVVRATRTRLLEIYDPSKTEPSMNEIARRVHDKMKATTGRDGPSSQAFHKLVKEFKAGPEVVEAIEIYFGEKREAWIENAQPKRFVEKEERYPSVAEAFADARAVGVSDAILDRVRSKIGGEEGAGPTIDEVNKLIRSEVARLAKLRAYLLPEQNVAELDEPPKLRRK